MVRNSAEPKEGCRDAGEGSSHALLGRFSLCGLRGSHAPSRLTCHHGGSIAVPYWLVLLQKHDSGTRKL